MREVGAGGRPFNLEDHGTVHPCISSFEQQQLGSARLWRGGLRPLTDIHLLSHHVNHIAILHIQLLRRLIRSEALPIKEETHLGHSDALPLAECVHELTKWRPVLALEKHLVAILGDNVDPDTIYDFHVLIHLESSGWLRPHASRVNRQLSLRMLSQCEHTLEGDIRLQQIDFCQTGALSSQHARGCITDLRAGQIDSLQSNAAVCQGRDARISNLCFRQIDRLQSNAAARQGCDTCVSDLRAVEIDSLQSNAAARQGCDARISDLRATSQMEFAKLRRALAKGDQSLIFDISGTLQDESFEQVAAARYCNHALMREVVPKAIKLQVLQLLTTLGQRSQAHISNMRPIKFSLLQVMAVGSNDCQTDISIHLRHPSP
mmetsp:Transcript_45978/g.76012  ORF Transcript_45978/g.76012 Transcript_45978/m.76012 type:complete len:376 (+) Transcript_45978:706-1833(+)